MKQTVLVLEDESIVMKVMRQILGQYSVVEATTAEEALMLFIDHNQEIDLLIADLTLPRMSGLQVALRLRTRLPSLPVIVTSGYPVCSWRARDGADLERLGPTRVTVLEKPFRAEGLLEAVHALIGTQQPAKRVNAA
jgi:two-component system cell cycle sensor histidine kinase/response regulator CckA